MPAFIHWLIFMVFLTSSVSADAQFNCEQALRTVQDVLRVMNPKPGEMSTSAQGLASLHQFFL